MPETRLQKARETLPEGYRYGDAGEGHRVVLLEPDEWVPRLPANTSTMTKRGQDRCERVAFPAWTPLTHLYEFTEPRDAR